MNTEKHLNKTLNPYIKERKLMNIEKFNQLLKRVNIEDDTEIKHRMLTVIEKYLGSLPVGVAPVEDAEDTTVQPENVQEEIIEVATTTEKVEEIAQEIVEETVTEEVEMNQDKAVEQVVEMHEQAEAEHAEELIENHSTEVTDEVMEETAAAEETPVEEAAVVEDTAAEVAEATNEPIAEATEETVEEAITEPVSEEPVEEDTNVDRYYVESFNLISTTKDEHLSRIIEEGGMIYRDKRSFMMGLWLGKELLALAKTTKFDEMPEHIQKHLKADGFAKVTVVRFGEITKKSRTRSVDVTFKDIEALDHDNALVVEIKDFLENPEKYVEEEEPKSEEKVTEPTHPATKQAASNQEEVKETAPKSEPVGNPQLVTTMEVDPRFVKLFEGQREQILAQTYGFVSDGKESGLYAKNNNGMIKIAKDTKTAIKPNQIKVKIADYALDTTKEVPTAQFTFNIIASKAVQPAPASEPVEEKAKEEPVKELVKVAVNAKGEVPSDFPKTNKLSLALHKQAEELFNAQKAKELIGKTINLGVLTREDNVNRVSLVYDVFEMATAANILSETAIRDSKWEARLTAVELVEEEAGNILNIEFDALNEVEKFNYESESKAIATFAPITPEGLAEREKERRQKLEEAKQKQVEEAKKAEQEQPAPEEETKPEVKEEAPRVEDMLHKDYTPEEARQLIEPKANADYKQGYKELVESQSKDMGGAMEEIRNRTSLTSEDRASLMEQGKALIDNVVDKTLAETNIHTKTEEKKSAVAVATKPVQTTQVVGNLQEGAGNLTETETVFKFSVPERFTPELWQKAAQQGKVLNLESRLHNKNGVTHKIIQMKGKNDAIVGQAIVPLSDAALVADGNKHTAVLLACEGATKVEGKGFVVALRLGNFKKSSISQ